MTKGLKRIENEKANIRKQDAMKRRVQVLNNGRLPEPLRVCMTFDDSKMGWHGFKSSRGELLSIAKRFWLFTDELPPCGRDNYHDHFTTPAAAKARGVRMQQAGVCENWHVVDTFFGRIILENDNDNLY